MGGRASREKGARFERELAKILTAAGFPASRNARNGISTDDIAHQIDGLHIEAKNCARMEIPKWWKQAESDAGDRDILLAVNRSRQEPLAVMTLKHYLELRARVDSIPESPIPTLP